MSWFVLAYVWACATGASHYEVAVGSRYVGSVPACVAYLSPGLSQSVRVRGCDADTCGRWSEASEPFTLATFQRLRAALPR